jgi:phosphatidylserine decarboxylase
MNILSRILGKLANSKITWLKNFLIKYAIKYYKIDMSLAAEPKLENYLCFNDFFIRTLKLGCRPIVREPNAIACPADGKISQIGDLNGQEMIQAKGFYFNLRALFGNTFPEYSAKFICGKFITIYLSPRDYHRVHIPLDGKLIAMIHIPGKLFSVQPKMVSKIPSLYSRNERVVIIFDTQLGLMAITLVGAALVASIVTAWEGQITPPTSKKIRIWDYTDKNIHFNRGDEIGRFQFGSTVILIFPPDTMRWIDNLPLETPVKMGQLLGILNKNRT